MKRLIKTTTLLFAAAALSVNLASAKTPPAINTSADLESAIKQVVSYPEHTVKEISCDMEVVFKITDDGHLKVRKTTGKPEFASHVTECLQKLEVENPELYGRFFSKTISFIYRK